MHDHGQASEVSATPHHMSGKYEGRLLLDGFDWETMRRFHGHLGPWLALGMKIGTHAYEELGFRPHFGVSVRVWCPLERPITCLLDGLQWSTGATLGKGNISITHSDALNVEIDGGQAGKLAYHIPPDTGDKFARLISDLGEDEATRAVWEAPLAEYCQVGTGQADRYRYPNSGYGS